MFSSGTSSTLLCRCVYGCGVQDAHLCRVYPVRVLVYQCGAGRLPHPLPPLSWPGTAARYFTFRRLFWLSNSFKVSHLRDALDTDIAIDPTSRVSDKSKSWMADI